MPRPTHSPFVEALSTLQRVLGVLDVGWYLFGAQAALIYGSSRSTTDLDVTVLLGKVSNKSLTVALKAAGFVLRFNSAKFVEQTRVFPVVHASTAVAVDLVIGGPGLEQIFLERSVRRKMGGATFPVARMEDIIAMKLLAGRGKDRDDIVDMLRANLQTTDYVLVRSTVAQLEAALDQDDLLPAFERMLAEATPRSTGVSNGRKRHTKKSAKKKRSKRP